MAGLLCSYQGYAWRNWPCSLAAELRTPQQKPPHQVAPAGHQTWRAYCAATRVMCNATGPRSSTAHPAAIARSGSTSLPSASRIGWMGLRAMQRILDRELLMLTNDATSRARTQPGQDLKTREELGQEFLHNRISAVTLTSQNVMLFRLWRVRRQVS